ncbi:Txe/YoeB family addiction module toxin [Danxiaibacter flavus]|uniref:Putative mRNA interferase YoeB n=1 Tax=Danxiaibacter flavus TaxID=3049108 RepID=A0ABV3ZEP4_9BACT|nr:Txe/YoeB family addiction module toxin [Chitinophagaceae bacterium DXS]
MKVIFINEAWEDYLYWQKTDKNVLKKINTLIKESFKSPHTGVGKPEPLKYDLAGWWSRRIDIEHRLVYKVEAGAIIILQCRYHY